MQRLFRRRSRCEPGDRRENRQRVADFRQFGPGADRRLAPVRHVRHHRLSYPRAGFAHFRFALQRFKEHNVGPCLAIGEAASDRALEAIRLPRVGASDDEHALGFASRGACDLDLFHHVLDGHDPLVGRMPALLGKLLILDLDRDHASRFIAEHGVMDVEKTAVARIRVRDHPSVHRSRERRNPV